MPLLPADAPADIRRIEERQALQRRIWRIQRAGWILMALFVLAALLGATGRGGPLATAETATPDGALGIRYDRIQRLNSPAAYRIEVRAPPPGGIAEIRLDRVFLRDIRLEPGQPVPVAAAAGPDGLRLAFRLAPGGAGPPPVVALRGTPETPFLWARPEVALGDGPPARLLVLVWP